MSRRLKNLSNIISKLPYPQTFPKTSSLNTPAPKDTTRVIAIDGGYSNCGYACIEADGLFKTVISYGTIQHNTPDKEEQKLQYPIYENMYDIAQTVLSKAKSFKADEAVIENMFVSFTARTMMYAIESRAVILSLLTQHFPVTFMPPTSPKKHILRHPPYTKSLMKKAVSSLYDIRTKLTEHEADAIALATTFLETMH